MREYLTNEERVNQATREALERRGYDHAKFNQVKREMADVRGFKMGDEGIEYVVNQMIRVPPHQPQRRGGLLRATTSSARRFSRS